jgi:hypothetical protein
MKVLLQAVLYCHGATFTAAAGFCCHSGFGWFLPERLDGLCQSWSRHVELHDAKVSQHGGAQDSRANGNCSKTAGQEA